MIPLTSRCTPLLRVARYEQVNMIVHGFQLDDNGAFLFEHLVNDLLESDVDVAGDDHAPVLGAWRRGTAGSLFGIFPRRDGRASYSGNA